ncbi:unnamed protein product [Anisakis simplex]|uniref:Probable metabotropic glutamate receptor mgl-1 (inferred by orthology to a C. elegans protein) n=1 Tax=Anisakis simplex TaxID=6269 RepID=A0A0M3JTD1_ANISI|nr:unnamed protein product [Anisakis simplex]
MYSLLAMATHIFANIEALEQQVSEDHTYLSQSNHVRQLRIPGDVIIGGVFPVHAKANSPDQPCGVITETRHHYFYHTSYKHIFPFERAGISFKNIESDPGVGLAVSVVSKIAIVSFRGVHRVEAMLYALDMINSQRDFLRGYKLGALILDSCSNPAYALNQSLDFVRDLIGSNDASEYRCRDGSSPESKHLTKKNVAAVVGGSYSSVTVQIANLLRLFKIVQVSPASTNADLSDKSRFEYFARTVPSDNYQARAMIDISLHFNWTYVSLVYSADEYGELGAEAFKKEARKVNICIAIEERILNKKKALAESIDNLVKKLQPDKVVGARVVVLFVGTEYVPELMLQTAEQMQLNSNRQQKKIIWLASEGWDRNNDAYTIGARKAAAEGAIVLMLESKRVPLFEEYFLSLNPGSDKFERNKWLYELWEHKFNCKFGLPDGSKQNRCENQRQTREDFNPDDKVQFVIDAVFAIAHGLQAMKQSVCPNDTAEMSWISRHSKMPHICSAMSLIDGEEFYQKYLLHVKFDDLVGKKFRFSPEGDGPAHYTILNYQPSFRDKRSATDGRRSEYVEVGRWSEDQLELNDEKMWWNDGGVPISQCSMPCPLGYRKQLIKVDEICCWACGKCEDYEYLINETTCMDCGQGRWPTSDRTDCFDLAHKHLRHMRWSSCETPIVKASGREVSYILLASMLMCYAMTFILISRPTPIVCAIKRTGIGFAFSCLYAAMLVKTNRIARIFSQATRSAQRPSCISPVSQILLTALLAGIQLFSSLIWLVVVPPGTRHDYPSRDQVVLTCNVPDHHFLYSLAYNAALIVLCTVYAVKTRKVPENFNETKFIGFSMYTTCVVWLSWIFFFFGTGSDFQIQTTSLCISISMSANVALVCIFSPKLWIIFFEKHKNVRKQDGEYMLSRRSAISAHDENTATQYTALLSDQRRRGSTRSSHQSISSSAQDIFL